ncbi:MAG TPA: protein kinase [Polyangia bacterium]|jgi:serine/threonine protein kinase|nr:protein kinase [Polyangia bacterium]
MRLGPDTILCDKYRIVRALGERADTDVFEARPVDRAGRYAVRLLCEGGIRSMVLLDALRREALSASALNHPGIVRVYDVDQAPDGSPFIVMDYLSGQDLDRVLRDTGALALSDVVAIVEAIAAPLGEAHRQGIIHGDLTPASVFVLDADADTHARVKILDFGVARIRAQAGGIVRDAGAPGYVAPERQGRSSQVDERTDVFALGAIAFALIGGSAPSVRAATGGHAAVSETARPLPAPPAVTAAVARAMNPRREGRFVSVTDFAQALRQAVSALPARVSGARPARSGATPAVPVPTLRAQAERARPSTGLHKTLAVAVGCGLAIVLGVRVFSHRPASRQVIANPSSERPAAIAPPSPKPAAVAVASTPVAVPVTPASVARPPSAPREARENAVHHHHPSAHAGMTEAARREMEEAYQKATRAFDIERYDEAIVAYKRTYELGGDPPMLYDIAQALRLSKHPDEAAAYYRRYLDRAPAAPNRDEVRARIAELAPKTPTPTPTSPPTPAKADAGAPAAGAPRSGAAAPRH